MSTSGCLITDVPQFQAPKHTAPFLLESCAQPSVSEVVLVKSSDLSTPIVFGACVVSQDDASGTFSQVSPKLYIDYGVAASPTQPFRYEFGGKPLTPGGTLDDPKQRSVSVQWLPDIDQVGLGCHTATLIVSHSFDMLTSCPLCTDDFSTLTWQILRCDDSMMGNCGSLPLAGPGQCMPPAVNATCAAVQSTDTEATPCPDAVPDGGAK
jgi:hypothetical protein